MPFLLSAVTPFPEVGAPRAITSGPHEHFFASYFGIDSWSADGRYVTVLETDLRDRMPEGAPATLGVVDLQDGNKFIPVAETRTWNFQEAAMAHWLPGEKDTFVYNDLRDGKFASVVRNWKTGVERILPMPVSAVSADGTWAVSINYARLYLTRPDYGYCGGGQDDRKNAVFPEDDGLWTMDMKTGERRLIVSTAAVKDRVPAVNGKGGLSYFCHTVISKDGAKVYWLSRSVEGVVDAKGGKNGKCLTTAFTCNRDGSDIRRCFPDGWGSSHFNWMPNGEHTMVVTARRDAKPLMTHVEFTVGKEDGVKQYGPGILDWDGHCIYSPDCRFISTDGYWNANGDRTWVLVRREDQAILPLGTFHVPDIYGKGHVFTRCDLHPRFRRDGSQIGFNSVHEGTRQVYVRDIKWRK